MSQRLSDMFKLLGEYRRAQLRDNPARLLGDACIAGNLADVMLVILHHPDCVRWSDAQTGQTALHIAIDHKHLEIVNILIQQGADIYDFDFRGVSGMDRARANGWEMHGGNRDPMREYAANRARKAYEDAMRSTASSASSSRARDYNESARRVPVYDAPTSAQHYDDTGAASFTVDDKGHLLSASGDIVVFADQKAAARWILTVANRANSKQVFEVANHPTRANAYTARMRTSAPKSASRPAGP